MISLIKNKFLKNYTPFKFISFFLFILIIYTLFNPIPTDSNVTDGVGIGSKLLNIGDRFFYFRNDNDICEKINSISLSCKSYYGQVKPGPLYPFILLSINNALNMLGINSYYAWNSLVILITVILTYLSLYFINKSSFIISRSQSGRYASWIFVLCPYTYFFALNGGLTMYLIFGVSFLTYLLIKLSLNSKIFFKKTIFIQSIIFCLTSIYLSLLRPTGTTFSLVCLSILIYLLIKKFIFIPKNKFLLLSIILITSTIIFLISQFYSYRLYIDNVYGNFISENGSFFGVDRSIIREILYKDQDQITEAIKSSFYTIIWKINDFIAGMLDIRDSHTSFDDNTTPIFPFLMRVTTGIFYLIPVNALFVFGLIKFRNRILQSGLWISLLASFVSISPSILGYSNSRFLIMFFPPFILIAGLMLTVIFNEEDSIYLESLK